MHGSNAYKVLQVSSWKSDDYATSGSPCASGIGQSREAGKWVGDFRNEDFKRFRSPGDGSLGFQKIPENSRKFQRIPEDSRKRDQVKKLQKMPESQNSEGPGELSKGVPAGPPLAWPLGAGLWAGRSGQGKGFKPRLRTFFLSRGAGSEPEVPEPEPEPGSGSGSEDPKPGLRGGQTRPGGLEERQGGSARDRGWSSRGGAVQSLKRGEGSERVGQQVRILGARQAEPGLQAWRSGWPQASFGVVSR